MPRTAHKPHRNPVTPSIRKQEANRLVRARAGGHDLLGLRKPGCPGVHLEEARLALGLDEGGRDCLLEDVQGVVVVKDVDGLGDRGDLLGRRRR